MERFRFASKTCLSMLVVMAALACGCFADLRSRTCVSSADCLQNEGETCVDRFCVFEPEGSPDLEDSFDVRNSPDLDASPDLDELSDAGDMSRCIELAGGRVASSGAWGQTVDAAQFDTVELRGTSSSDEDGEVQSYEWTVTERPDLSLVKFSSSDDSPTPFSPPNDSPTPSVFLDRASDMVRMGDVDIPRDYVFELSVFDDQGLQSCSPAEVTVTAAPAGGAVPDTGIYVVLTWGTVRDDDPTDGVGTDLDLHFLHQGGVWGADPWDLNWSNPTPDWGLPGLDPIHSGDVDGGWGPETVTLKQPENDTTYSVGVNYVDANGYGPSDATVLVEHPISS